MNKVAARFYEPILGRLLKDLRTQVLSLSKLTVNSSYLDCCCGAGGLLRLAISEHCGQLLGIDLSLDMLAQAKCNAPAAHLFCANAVALPFANRSIDVSSVCMALHAMPLDVAMQSLQELKRVSKHVVIADYCLLERNAYIPPYALAYAIEYLVGGEHYKCYKSFMQFGAIEGLLHHMGYAVQERRITLGGAGKVLLI